MENIPSEMLRGHIDTIILLSLLDSDKHTAQIKEEIEQRTDGQFQLKQGTFYSCLQRIAKQGLVTEYRTSNTPDGVRRKFFQLTEKGKNYIDENKDIWAHSRQLINTLIQTPEAKTVEKQVVETKSEVKPYEPSVITQKMPEKEETVVPAETESPRAEEDDSPEESLKDFLSETIVAPSEPVSKQPNAPKKTEERKSTSKTLTQTDNFDLFDYMDLNDKKEDLFSEHVPDEYDEPDYYYEEETESEPVKSEQSVEKPFENKVEIKPVKEEITKEPKIEPTEIKPVETKTSVEKYVREKQDESANDYFNPDTSVPSDYRSVLSKIFNTEADASAIEKPRVVDYNEGFNVKEFFEETDKGQIDRYPIEKDVKKADYRSVYRYNSSVKEAKIEDNSNYSSETTVHHPYYDFSDIESMADREGFRIKVSSSESVKESGRILINKLLFHSSLTFFVIILIETLVMYFATASTAALNFLPYGLFIAAVAIFPAVCAALYFINRDKKVSKITPLKSAAELVIIIMLNLSLILIVCLVLSNINFSDQVSVMRYVIYPAIMIINIPLYVFIKYFKLDKDKYFD